MGWGASLPAAVRSPSLRAAGSRCHRTARGRPAEGGERQDIHAAPGKAGWAGERAPPCHGQGPGEPGRAAAEPELEPHRGCPAGRAARAEPALSGSSAAARPEESAPIPSHRTAGKSDLMPIETSNLLGLRAAWAFSQFAFKAPHQQVKVPIKAAQAKRIRTIHQLLRKGN